MTDKMVEIQLRVKTKLSIDGETQKISKSI